MHASKDSGFHHRCHPEPDAPLRRLRARLLARIHRRYRTVSETLQFGRLHLPFTRIREPDDVLDQIVEEEDRREKITGRRTPGDDLHLPYWAELWDSSFGLAAFLVDHSAWRSPRLQPSDQTKANWTHTLDVGCGMGLSGLVAAALGAHVTLADLEPEALLFARLNTVPYHDRVRARQLDWRRDRLDQQFDLILGADVLYERAQWAHLEPFWRAHLAPGGAVLLGEPGRQTGDMFPDWIRTRGGWSLERFDQRVPTRERPIRIYRLTRTAQTRDADLR